MTFEDDLIQRLKDDEFAREYIHVNKPFTRCEDCRYGSRDVYDHSNVMPIWCEYCNDYRNEMDFCSRGEKR